MSERGGGIGNSPGEPSQIPGVPENFLPIVFQGFETLDTKTERPGIKPTDMAWCDGFMPLGPNNLRILPGVGDAVFTSVNPSVIWFNFGNISVTPYLVVLLSDGSVVARNLAGSAVIAILGPGGISGPDTIFGFTQWGSQYLLLANDQPNGYWLWDGSNTFTAGTLDPNVVLINPGSNYTTTPTITPHTTGGGGSTAFLTQIDATNGQVVRFIVSNPGSGFAEGDLVSLVITGGGSDDQAFATASLSAGGGVTGIVVTDPGKGYTFNTQITVVGGGGSGATFVPNIVNGAIMSVTVINPGSGYTSPPSPLATDPGYGSGASHVAGGTGAAGYATIGANGLASINVVNGGSGYTSVPQVVILGDGQNAAATATIVGGAVTAITVVNPGSGYTKALVDIRGGNNAANATASIFPFGLSGTALEIYQSRVWLTNGGAAATFPPQNRTIFTAADSPTDVDPANGAGAFKSNDSFLRIGYFALRQTNGFLYLIGDSSLNAISGVQTSSTGTPPTTTTTFSNQNADPQIGSPWPSSVQQFKRNIVMANTLGIFISYGGAVEKISDALDGFYASDPQIFLPGKNFSSAVAEIFGRYVYMLLLPVFDPVTGQHVSKLLMTDGKRWWTSQQDHPLGYIASQEFNSVLTAYGTDGAGIYPLFQRPSTAFTKRLQSKLWEARGYFTNKTTLHALGVVKYFSADPNPIILFADNETGVSASISVPAPGAAATEVFGPIPIGQQGRLTGISLQTDASDVAILSVMLAEQEYTPTL